MPPQDLLQKLPKKSTALLLIAILCFGGFLRLANMHNEQAWYDEIATLRHLQAATLGQYLELIKPQNPVHPPLYFIAQFIWSRAFGASEYATRMLSITAGMLSLAMIFILTRKLYNNKAALIATLWMSFIPFHIYHAQQIRFYAFMTLFALLSMYIFVKLLDDRRARWLVLLTLIDLAIVWNHPLGAALFLGQAVYLLAYHRKQIPLLATWAIQHILIVASLLPWALRIESDLGDRSLQWLPAPSLFGGAATVEGVLRTAVGSMDALPTNGIGETLLFLKPSLTLALLASYIIAIAYLLRPIPKKETADQEQEISRPSRRRPTVLLLCWLLIPPIALFILSHAWRPSFFHRYLIFTMIPLYILIGAFLAQLPQRIRIIALTTLLILNLGYQATFHLPGPQRTRYRDATATILQAHTEPERVLAIGVMDISALDYRLTKENKKVNRLKNEKALMAELDRLPENFTPLWIVLSKSAVTRRTLKRCKKLDLACTQTDMSSAKYLTIIYIQPPGPS